LDIWLKVGGWVKLPDPILLNDGRKVHLEIFNDEASIPLLAGLTDTLRKRVS